MASDLFKRNEVATVAGMAGTFGNAGLLVFSLLIGALVATIGYTPFFVCLGVLDLVGAVVLWTVVRERARAATERSMSDRSIRNPILRGFNPGSVHRPRRRRLLHRDLDVRVVPRRADPPLARPRALAAADAAAATARAS